MTKIFQSIMDDPIGVNLRNLNAHGVLEPEKGNGSSALYLLCLVIRLLSMYYPNAFTIVKKLAEKDSCAETGWSYSIIFGILVGRHNTYRQNAN